MEVLSARLLLAPSDLDAGIAWYTGVLGLRTYREYGTGGRRTGVVLFLGGGFLELTGPRAGAAAGPAGPVLWLQVPDVDAEHERLVAAGAHVAAAPETMPWGLRECWVSDPDGTRIVLVEVPEGHPIRSRLD
ncbi:MAG: VOC family protein [Actinobacteria bacterium]|nr:VOC family protein [Actinomycetota bacterium]